MKEWRRQAALRVVLIVPLWNWNIVDKAKNEAKISFNCTFMELKSVGNVVSGSARSVLIVPLWIWNSLAQGA